MSHNVEQLSINTIRTLTIDAVENASSGHPGMPMGAAPMAYTLWTKVMNHNPNHSSWFNRDRFVLSAGHGSMLLYALLHLSGYDVSINDIKNFRQWGSNTPGHPEFGHTDGVEATTGPLGQGIAMSVGMAMAERFLASTYNKPDHEMVDHYTYAICGDGDLMEGVSQEAASLAGHLKLGKLVVMYDSNDISLDGDLNRAFSESVEDRFKAYGWQVIRVEDGNDTEAIEKALLDAKANEDQPTLIEVKTVIGYGSPNKGGKSDAHGAPLGEDERQLAKEHYEWAHDEFHVPDEVKADFKDKVQSRGEITDNEWNQLLESYKNTYPDLAQEFEQAMNGELPAKWNADLPTYDEDSKALATRAASGEVLNAIAKNIPYFFGGSADLAGSNKTTLKGEDDFKHPEYSGRNIWFGVREFAMACALNGMALHGGVKVFGGTFFVFSDYLRPALRLSALMGTPVTYVFTHDSIAVGEDGPTHEPIEQLPSLRAMPNLNLIRPADANETKAAWEMAMQADDQPTALVLTRQGLPVLPQTNEKASEGVAKGAYVLKEADKDQADLLLLASGSEVQLVMKASEQLKEEGIDATVVSMPSWSLFDQQDDAYKESVIPSNIKNRLAVEMASPFGWERYTGIEGDVLGIDTFGASAPGQKVIDEYGFTVENVVKRAKTLLSK
ncbi:transketolase [Tenuibacillus multivorans]|uniref:Transketolase n=1 Tax=Tenuibacillus multivorans TaxID=237069 RepID=A0A1H0CGP3_9BACI|nr:transketolase [Tenuibacillus multivorans]GEL76301.1 transketolase [Tenuibacillus multivorans]SDN57088.1 transketolase [Tenuibacillus multivorans]